MAKTAPMNERGAEAAGGATDTDGSATRAWLRALELTAAIARNPHRTFSTVIEDLAETAGESPALLSDGECLTYRGLEERVNRYARWALGQGLVKGDVVCLFMPNRPEYMAMWLGITRAGGVVSLLNTNLAGASFAHCVNIVAPRHIVVAAELFDRVKSALLDCAGRAMLWAHGGGVDELPRIDREVERQTGEPLLEGERRMLTVDDRALYIYTSGTTGLPKAATVSHFRLMQWTHWFAGMMNVRASDRMYNCLPMYHSVGGVLATGAVLVGGGSVVIREKFSARQFWNDVSRWDCTLFQYIGELCRYLLQTESSPQETAHRVRMAVGNGLCGDIWNEFRGRFHIPRILEFYAATEGIVSLFNVDGKPGAIGRVPSFLAHRFPATLVKFDVERGTVVRDEQGWCVRCAPNEVGEAIGKTLQGSSDRGRRFEGYTNGEASESKILRNVFEVGDTWFRTGDLMRKDAQGYFYFVDRVGDTFRWKGENVATAEVMEAICAFPGVKAATVYGVTVPRTDGRAGMATLVIDAGLDLAAFRTHLIDRLPAYARPLFLRIRPEIPVTGTFKHMKNDLMREGYDPTETADVLYFDDPECHAFVRLDRAVYDRIQTDPPVCDRRCRPRSAVARARQERDASAYRSSAFDTSSGRPELSEEDT
jgi:fatty-acyl-CoA synthase